MKFLFYRFHTYVKILKFWTLANTVIFSNICALKCPWVTGDIQLKSEVFPWLVRQDEFVPPLVMALHSMASVYHVALYLHTTSWRDGWTQGQLHTHISVPNDESQPNGLGGQQTGCWLLVDVVEMDTVRYCSCWMSDRYFMKGVTPLFCPPIFFIVVEQKR